MWLLANQSSWMMFLTGITIIIVVMLRIHFRYRRSLGKERSATGGPDMPMTKSRPASQPPPEFTQWEVAMHETSRQLRAELDSKISVLQSMVAMAQEQSSRLEQAIQRAEQLGISANRDILAEIQDGAYPLSGAIHSEVEQPVDGKDRNQTFPVSDDCRARIYCLADRGKSPKQISDVVEATLGEIEMALQLRQDS